MEVFPHIASAEPGILPPFSFSATPLKAEQQQSLRSHLQEWSARYGLGDERSRRTAEAYVYFCSPEAANPRGIELDATYMSWYFAYNDLEPTVDIAAALLEAKTILLDGEPAPLHNEPSLSIAEEARPRVSATIGFRNAIYGLLSPVDTTNLRSHLRHLFESLVWEARLPQTIPPTLDYLKHRLHTVGALPHFELWKLALGINAPPGAEALLRAAEESSAKAIYISNDIMSVRRDRRKGKLNLIFCLMHEYGISEPEATHRASSLLNDSLLSLGEARAGILIGAGREAQCAAYADFLCAAVEGNRRATMALRERYLGSE